MYFCPDLDIHLFARGSHQTHKTWVKGGPKSYTKQKRETTPYLRAASPQEGRPALNVSKKTNGKVQQNIINPFI